MYTVLFLFVKDSFYLLIIIRFTDIENLSVKQSDIFVAIGGDKTCIYEIGLMDTDKFTIFYTKAFLQFAKSSIEGIAAVFGNETNTATF